MHYFSLKNIFKTLGFSVVAAVLVLAMFGFAPAAFANLTNSLTVDFGYTGSADGVTISPVETTGFSQLIGRYYVAGSLDFDPADLVGTDYTVELRFGDRNNDIADLNLIDPDQNGASKVLFKSRVSIPTRDITFESPDSSGVGSLPVIPNPNGKEFFARVYVVNDGTNQETLIATQSLGAYSSLVEEENSAGNPGGGDGNENQNNNNNDRISINNNSGDSNTNTNNTSNTNNNNDDDRISINNNSDNNNNNNNNNTTTITEFSKLQNPLGEGGVRSFTGFVERVLNIVIMVGVPIVVLAIIWSGFLYVKAQGNPEKIKAAHQTLFWTIIGAVLLIGSYTIATAIQGTVEKIGTGEITGSRITHDRDIA